MRLKLSELWNHRDFMNALFLASIVSIIYWTFQPHYDYDFAHYGPYNGPYGVLWYLLNFQFKNWQLYTYQVTLVQLPVIVLQLWLVKKGKLPMDMVTLTLMMTALLRMMNTEQNVTVIMFAPFVLINPVFALLPFLQKFALGWSWDLSDEHWKDFWYQTHDPRFQPFNFTGNSTFVMPYYILMLWTVLPLVFWFVKWWKNRRKKPCDHCLHYVYEHAPCCKCEARKKELDEWWENLKNEGRK